MRLNEIEGSLVSQLEMARASFWAFSDKMLVIDLIVVLLIGSTTATAPERVAVCLVGQPRSLELTATGLRAHLLASCFVSLALLVSRVSLVYVSEQRISLGF